MTYFTWKQKGDHDIFYMEKKGDHDILHRKETMIYSTWKQKGDIVLICIVVRNDPLPIIKDLIDVFYQNSLYVPFSSQNLDFIDICLCLFCVQ